MKIFLFATSEIIGWCCHAANLPLPLGQIPSNLDFLYFPSPFTSQLQFDRSVNSRVAWRSSHTLPVVLVGRVSFGRARVWSASARRRFDLRDASRSFLSKAARPRHGRDTEVSRPGLQRGRARTRRHRADTCATRSHPSLKANWTC